MTQIQGLRPSVNPLAQPSQVRILLPPSARIPWKSAAVRWPAVDERGDWQQRIRAVLYHHGLPRRSDLDLLTAAGRDWIHHASPLGVARFLAGTDAQGLIFAG